MHDDRAREFQADVLYDGNQERSQFYGIPVSHESGHALTHIYRLSCVTRVRWAA